MNKLLTVLGRVFLPADVQEVAAQVALLRRLYCSGDKERLPPVLIDALIAGEDHRFRTHDGVDVRALARCLRNYILKGKIEGGSTIDQQFVRTIVHRYERTVSRKFREILLASYLQQLATKDEIADLYLRIAYFGWRMNGIVQACRRLGVGLHNITREEAALVVAALKYPLPRVATLERRAQIETRQAHILRRMANGGKL